MKAIIIAAGMGARLEDNTSDRPKCMVSVGGKPILKRQVEALRKAGVDKVVVVRGYLAQAIPYDDLTYYENRDYRNNNILLSLFTAIEEMDDPFISSYADILYESRVIKGLIEAPGDIVLAVDTRWAEAYVGRHDHPEAEAELTEVEGDRVLAVGKRVGSQKALGEFMGLARFNREGARVIKETYLDLQTRYQANMDAPFGNSPTFKKAYLTDILEELIRKGQPIGYVAFDGGWREIDTVQDLHRVRKEVDGGLFDPPAEEATALSEEGRHRSAP